MIALVSYVMYMLKLHNLHCWLDLAHKDVITRFGIDAGATTVSGRAVTGMMIALKDDGTTDGAGQGLGKAISNTYREYREHITHNTPSMINITHPEHEHVLFSYIKCSM